MPVFDALTLTGTTNTQTETWAMRPGCIRTSSVSTVTIDTIAVPNNQGVLIECRIDGRLVAAPFTIDSEFSESQGINNAGTLTVGLSSNAVWHTRLFTMLSFSASGTNIVVSLTPPVASTMDWQWVTSTATV